MSQLRPVVPLTPQGCEGCPQTGSSWVHLRLCLTRGHVGCCRELVVRWHNVEAEAEEPPVEAEPVAVS